METKDRKVFFLYTVFIAALIIVGFSFLYIFHDKLTYNIVVRAYNVIEYSFLAYFFHLLLKNRSVRSILLFSPIAFFIFAALNYFNTTDPIELPFVPLAVEYVIMLIFITYFFFEVMQHTTTEPVYQKAFFWISTAFIINFSGNFFLFLYSKNSYKEASFSQHYTIIYSTVTILKDILLCISAVIKEKKETSLSHPFNDTYFDDFQPLKTQLNK